MKKNLLPLIIIIVLLVIAIAVVAYFLLMPAPQAAPTQSTATFPTSGQATAEVPDQATQDAIAKNFHTQVPQSNNLVLLRTNVSDQYAIASWQDQYIGGTVVLEKDTTNNWKIILMDGGVLTDADLEKVGVPESVATVLLATQESP
jgi:hypothetical protein